MLQSSSNRHISTSTVQSRWSNCSKETTTKDTNKKKRLAWAKKHEQWTLDRWKSVLWTDESKFEDFGSNHCDFVRCRVGEWMISTCVVPTVKHGRGGVTVWECFVGDNVSDLFRIQGTLKQHAYHSILQRYAIPSGLCLVWLSFFESHCFTSPK